MPAAASALAMRFASSVPPSNNTLGMTEPWLSIVGIGEDGLSGLSREARDALDGARQIFGGRRHLELAGIEPARAAPWPIPFDLDPVVRRRGTAVAVLASGDPFWYGVGSRLAVMLPRGEWRAWSQASSASLLAARLGWPLERTRCLGLHVQPLARLRPILHDGGRCIVLLAGGDSLARLATWLCEAGYGQSRLHLGERLGGPAERLRSLRADHYDLVDVAAPVIAGIEFSGPPGLPRHSGLDDAQFHHDGQITKRAPRTLALAALAPRPEELLWDLGAGSGSIAVEWCLAGGRACAVERRIDRVLNIERNVSRYGLSRRLKSVLATSAACLARLDSPAAVFVGGGGDAPLLDALWARLGSGVRLVVHAVTLETEALLVARHAAHGGALMRVEIADAEPLGRYRSWRRSRPIVQWSVVR